MYGCMIGEDYFVTQNLSNPSRVSIKCSQLTWKSSVKENQRNWHFSFAPPVSLSSFKPWVVLSRQVQKAACC